MPGPKNKGKPKSNKPTPKGYKKPRSKAKGKVIKTTKK